MKKNTLIKLAVCLVALIAIIVLAVVIKAPETVVCPDCAGEGEIESEMCETCTGIGTIPGESAPSIYYSTFMALVPPLIAIALALITKEVYSSLLIGIIAGGIFYSLRSPLGAVDAIINNGFITAVADNAGIFIFLVILGIMVALINKAGGSAAFGKWAKEHIKTKTGAQLATFALGVLIFIDDYFNCLTVGSVMRPVSDSHKISRAKLAYLIDATAAPICMIAPISSWAAAVSSYAEEGQGLALFVKAIPYNFYSILTIVMIIFMSVAKFDYGPMKKHELNAANGDLFTTGEVQGEADEEVNPRGKVIDLLLPIIVLIAICVFALVYVGGILDGSDFITAFGNTDATVGLPWGAMIALIITVIYLIARRAITFKDAMDAVPKGFCAMVPAILILTMATALKNMTALLGAKYFVSGVMEGAAGGLNMILPAIIFLVACGLSFSTGTSWGTFGILIPIVISVFAGQGEILTIGISACLAGAVCGDHCSPISDTTIMSSAGAQCNHVNHVSTQLPYAITVAVVSFVCYIIAGFVNNWLIVLPISVVLMIATLLVIKQVTKSKSKA